MIRPLPRYAVLALLPALLSLATPVTGQGKDRLEKQARSLVTSLPLCFVENRGQVDGAADFTLSAQRPAADAGDAARWQTAFFNDRGVTHALRNDRMRWVVKQDFVGAERVRPVGAVRRETVFNYFSGGPAMRRTGVPSYGRLLYRNLWPGVDLAFDAGTTALKYTLTVQPGADPTRVRFRYRGARRVRLVDGALSIETAIGTIRDDAPIAYQVRDGVRVPVGVRFDLDTGDRVNDDGMAGILCGFSLDDYDRTRPLVIDPTTLLACGYVGGMGSEFDVAAALDSAGNLYITGTTSSDERSFPVTVGPDLTHGGGPTPSLFNDAFVAKLNASGTALIYCGYIGGTDWDRGSGIAVDNTGAAYVIGTTRSTQATFPVAVGPDLTHNGGTNDAFIAKVTPSGTGLVYCGYIGGAGNDIGGYIALQSGARPVVAGWTDSTEQSFPVLVGPDLTQNGLKDGFIAGVKADGTGLEYCGYHGGSGQEFLRGVGVDLNDNLYVVGSTTSSESSFPVLDGPDLTFNGMEDVYVAGFTPGAVGLRFSGYVGGTSQDLSGGIAVNPSGTFFIAGHTRSTEQSFPVKTGPDLTHNGGVIDAFVAKLGSVLITGSGTNRLGGRIDFSLVSAADPGRAYQVGTSFGTGPISIGPRRILLSPDDLLVMSLGNLIPGVFVRYGGTLDSKGAATAALRIPTFTALIGVTLHTAFVTLRNGAPNGIESIADPFSFRVTP